MYTTLHVLIFHNRGAIFCLKRKKMYEAEIEKLQGARITLEQQAMSLEGASVNIEVFKAVESGVHAMKTMRGNLDAARVDKIMDDIEEEKDLADQISEAITRPAQDMFDDEELLNELAELEEREREEAATLPSVKKTVSLPSNIFMDLPVAPTGPVVIHETEEEAALRELQASML
jgi:charged multivesicular body protein 4